MESNEIALLVILFFLTGVPYIFGMWVWGLITDRKLDIIMDASFFVYLIPIAGFIIYCSEIQHSDIKLKEPPLPKYLKELEGGIALKTYELNEAKKLFKEKLSAYKKWNKLGINRDNLDDFVKHLNEMEVK